MHFCMCTLCVLHISIFVDLLVCIHSFTIFFTSRFIVAIFLFHNSNIGQSKPTYVPPKDLGKYSPLHNSLQQLPMDVKGSQRKESFQRGNRDRRSARERKPVSRTQSAPHRPQADPKQLRRRQSSTENLPLEDQEGEQEANPPLDISSPQNVSLEILAIWFQLSTFRHSILC